MPGKGENMTKCQIQNTWHNQNIASGDPKRVLRLLVQKNIHCYLTQGAIKTINWITHTDRERMTLSFSDSAAEHFLPHPGTGNSPQSIFVSPLGTFSQSQWQKEAVTEYQ